MKKKIANNASTLFQALLIPTLIIVSMEMVGRMEIITSQLFVTPKAILEIFVELIKSGELLNNLAVSILRITAGFLTGTASGLLFGAAMGISRTFEEYVGPLFHALRQIPVLAWIPLLILTIGFGEDFKVYFIAVTAFYPMALNTSDGVKGVSRSYLEVGRVFEFSRLKQFGTIILPAALPSVFTGLRLSLSISWMAVVGAELVAASEGIGHMMYQARQQLHVDTVIICIVTIGLAGYVMSLVMERIERYFLRWRGAAE